LSAYLDSIQMRARKSTSFHLSLRCFILLNLESIRSYLSARSQSIFSMSS
jgi:hypothetical protein